MIILALNLFIIRVFQFFSVKTYITGAEHQVIVEFSLVDVINQKKCLTKIFH